jgi:hypothetical protein
MKARPIVCKPNEVTAILDGRKTQARRAINPQPTVDGGADDSGYGRDWWLEWKDHENGYHPEELAKLCPYGKPGDLLWVRESFNYSSDAELHPNEAPNPLPQRAGYLTKHLVYAADGVTEHPEFGKARWKASTCMPRWASRITLEITGIRVERLQDVSEEDARAEGVTLCERDGDGSCLPYRDAYERLWQSIHGKKSWDANPWVWCVSFTPILKNVDEFMERTPE